MARFVVPGSKYAEMKDLGVKLELWEDESRVGQISERRVEFCRKMSRIYDHDIVINWNELYDGPWIQGA